MRVHSGHDHYAFFETSQKFVRPVVVTIWLDQELTDALDSKGSASFQNSNILLDTISNLNV